MEAMDCPADCMHRQEWEAAILAEREARIHAEGVAALHAAELAVLRPRISELEARLAAARRHPDPS